MLSTVSVYFSFRLFSISAYLWSVEESYGPCRKKTWRNCMRKTKAQASLRIRAVWRVPLLWTVLKFQLINLLHVQIQHSQANRCNLAGWFDRVMHGQKPRRQSFSLWCPFISLLKFTCFLIVLNKITLSGDKVCFKRFECRYISSVGLTERSMSVLLYVFRYSYTSPACSNSTQRSSGAKKPEQRSV